jgi:uncharacterized protein
MNISVAGSPSRPSPVADPDSAPFWESCRARQIAAQRCLACGRWRSRPAGICPHCHQRGGEWVALSGSGTISSFVIVHRTFHPAFSETPYAVVYVALSEAPDDLLLMSNLRGVAPEAIRIGMPVHVIYEELPDGIVLPIFALDENA